MRTFIIGSGTELPERIVTNEELATRLGIDTGQIVKSSGIRERRWADEESTTSALGSMALRRALDAASVMTPEVDYLLLGTMTADRFIPGAASAIQHKLSLREIPCLDIRAACCNTLYGLQLARALVSSKTARNVALCLSEVQSPFLDLSQAAGTTSMLFGDGAAALVISNEQRNTALEIIDVYLATDGRFVDDLGIRRPGSEFRRDGESDIRDSMPRMNGQAVILHASRKMLAACHSVLERNGLEIKDVKWIVPHQANANLLAQLARGLGLTNPNCVVSVLENTGNTSSAGMGIALDKLLRNGRLCEGEYVLMPAFAAGFTWGAALCRAT
jgi:3-oxoacyl-[acyl-carrier-protein] synthase-3